MACPADAVGPGRTLLGWQAKATKKVALDLFPMGNTGPYMEYRCGEVENPLATLEGSVLAPVVAGKMAKARLIKYSETGGLQKPERFEGMPKDVLTIVQSEKSEQIGQGASTNQTSEEALEINAVV